MRLIEPYIYVDKEDSDSLFLPAIPIVFEVCAHTSTILLTYEPFIARISRNLMQAIRTSTATVSTSRNLMVRNDIIRYLIVEIAFYILTDTILT